MYDSDMIFEYLNNNLGYNPLDVTGVDIENIVIWRYYARALYQRIISGVDFKIPEYWDKAYNYVKNVLFSIGYIGVIDSYEYGIIPQFGTLQGVGLYYQPTRLLVANPLCTFDGEIGVDCELLRLTPDYMGIWDIINHYTLLLTELYISSKVGAANVRSTVIMGAENKAAHKTLKLIADYIHKGKNTIIVDESVKSNNDTEMKLKGASNNPIWQFATNAKEQYVIHDLLSDIDLIIQQFDREIGILALGEKKERRTNEEVNIMVQDSNARPQTWKDSLIASIKSVNSLFPDLDLGVSIRYGGNEYSYNTSERGVYTDEF